MEYVAIYVQGLVLELFARSSVVNFECTVVL
jgi:hypothetical protein